VRKDQCLQWIFDRAGNRDVIRTRFSDLFGRSVSRSRRRDKNESVDVGRMTSMNNGSISVPRHIAIILLYSTVSYASWSWYPVS
jgi:hypothetical protein